MYEEALVAVSADSRGRQIDLEVDANRSPFDHLHRLIKESWGKISPFWPLKNLIAVNPLQGFENLSIESAMLEAAAFFEQKAFPEPMQAINKQTIKWLQAFFDEGQATIGMPLRKNGLYLAWKKLAWLDDQIQGGNVKKRQWLSELPASAEAAVIQCLLMLKIPKEEWCLFLTLMLTTLPGWASYIKYRIHWAEGESLYPVSEADYIALRLIITTVLWEEAVDLIQWHKKAREQQIKKASPVKEMQKYEAQYLLPLLEKFRLQTMKASKIPEAQLVFCIDVRSEPFRRALEHVGSYETFGFAGFFGVPVWVRNAVTEESYASCPVFLKPKHIVEESPCSSQIHAKNRQGYQKLSALKRFYQSLKYNVTTSFVLVELIGFVTGLWMALRTLLPIRAIKLSEAIVKRIHPDIALSPSLENISFSDQCAYAESVLRAMGLTNHFSPLVVFCGHGSATQNNAYATALDCGACGGRHGASNARILAKILNTLAVRESLKDVGILIPKSTCFIAAQHNTTRDDIELYIKDVDDAALAKRIQTLKDNLDEAVKINRRQRSKVMGFDADETKLSKHPELRSVDWAQVRPEWGLARNASFIVAPRQMTEKIDLEGRAFLHSYDYRQDLAGTILTGILMGPMVVAQWINSQYLFSTLDNVAYGAGSKITKNITGKIGIMQGNASDLMSGLPLQSVYQSDKMPYHEPVRLMVIVCAPVGLVDSIIEKQPVLQKLFGHGWVLLTCIDPDNLSDHYFMCRDLTWRKN